MTTTELKEIAEAAIQSDDDAQILRAIYILAQHVPPERVKAICVDALKN